MRKKRPFHLQLDAEELEVLTETLTDSLHMGHIKLQDKGIVGNMITRLTRKRRIYKI